MAARTLKIAHVDVDAFFASVEQALDPRLRGQPVLVGRGVVASASYEAKARGVRTAMSFREARRLCPDAVVVAGQYEHYADYAERLRRILADFTPAVELAALDDFYLDFTGTDRLYPDFAGVLRGMQQRVEGELGLTVSVGAATSKLVASVASRLKRPRGFRIVAPGAEEEFLAPLEIEKLHGIGHAHAATYADLSYRIAYLKAHYPAEFLAAMCSSGAGFYHVSAYVEEAKRWGIEVRLPSVNHSRLEYTTEESETRNLKSEIRDSLLDSHRDPCEYRVSSYGLRFPAMRIGLMQVKGLRLDIIRAIVRSREERGPYTSLEDFLARVPVERDEIEALIKCGALDDVGQTSTSVRCAAGERTRTGLETCPTRPALLWQLNLLRRAAPAVCGDALLFPDAAPWRPAALSLPPQADYTREQRLAYEQEILEVTVSGHPLDLAARNGETWSTDLEKLRGKRVTLLGWMITFRHVPTKNYRNMMFVTLEDQRGLFEAVLFPEAYEKYGGLVFETRMLRVTGRVEPDGNIHCEKMEPLKK